MIYVDADACPVKDEVLKVADRHGIKVFIVSNGGMRPSRDPMVENVIVSQGADVADDWIAERAGAGDVVVTADILLAGRCVANEAAVISPTGKEFDAANIGMVVASRNLNQQLRESGEIKGHNAPFSAKDRSQFLQVLDRVLNQIGRNS